MQTRGTFSELNSGMTGPKKKKQAFPAYFKQSGLPRSKAPSVPSVGRRGKKAAGAGSNPFTGLLPLVNKAVRG